jgi:hypothetical protein
MKAIKAVSTERSSTPYNATCNGESPALQTLLTTFSAYFQSLVLQLPEDIDQP